MRLRTRLPLLTYLLLRVPHEMNTCSAHSEKTSVWEIHRNRAITVWHCGIPRGGRYILGSHRSIT